MALEALEEKEGWAAILAGVWLLKISPHLSQIVLFQKVPDAYSSRLIALELPCHHGQEHETHEPSFTFPGVSPLFSTLLLDLWMADY